MGDRHTACGAGIPIAHRVRSCTLHAQPAAIDSLPFALDAFDYAMAWHPRVHHDPAHRWLRERLFAGLHDDSDA